MFSLCSSSRIHLIEHRSDDRNRLKNYQSYQKQLRAAQCWSIRHHCPRRRRPSPLNDPPSHPISSSDPSPLTLPNSSAWFIPRFEIKQCSQLIARGHGTSDHHYRQRSTVWNVSMSIDESDDISLSKRINRSRFISF